MKIVGVEVPIPEEVDSNVLADEGEGEGKADQDHKATTENREIDSSGRAQALTQFPTEEGDDSKVSRTRVHNILCKLSRGMNKAQIFTPSASANGNTSIIERSATYSTHSLSGLVLIYGNGRVDAYDLNRATEASSFVMFLKAKYPVVIGITANKWPKPWKKECCMMTRKKEGERRYPQPSSNVLTFIVAL